MAAERGDAHAQYNIGTLYERGRGVAQDYAEALKWYRVAAAKGDVQAATAIARAFEDASAAYKRKDYASALSLFRSLAEQGDTRAQGNIGVMYSHGEGVPQKA